LQVNVSAANFGEFNFEKRGVRFEFGLRNFADFNWRVRFGDDSDEWHLRRIEFSHAKAQRRKEDGKR